MKKFLLFVGILCMTYTVNAQTQKTILPELTEIEEDYYQVIYLDNESKVNQKGFYKVVDNKLIKDGIWKMYNNNKVVIKAEFKNNELVWIKSDGVTHTVEEIELFQLRDRVKMLENSIAMKN